MCVCVWGGAIRPPTQIIRLIHPSTDLHTYTSLPHHVFFLLQVLNPSGRELALQRGANVVMPIITPTRHRGDYMIYEDKPCVDEDSTKWCVRARACCCC